MFLIRRLDGGGAERQLALLARELHRRGLAVSVGSFYPGGIFEQELKEAGVPLHCLDKHGRWDVLGFVVRLLRWLWLERPAVVYGYLSTANLLLVLLRPALKMRGIAVACGIRASAFELSMYDWLTRFIEIQQLRALRFADAVICNSMAGRDLVIASGTLPSKCLVVENGIDTDRFRFAEEGRARRRQALGVDESQTLIGMVGRHDPVKGYEFLIAAAAILAGTHPHVRFVAVGSEVPGYSDDLRTRVDDLALGNQWIWAGHVDDLADLYSALDVFCLASTSEGFPNVIGEAMSCGLPCVVTNAGDAARLIGDIGWVVPICNAHALAVALTSAIETLPHWDMTLPRRRIHEHYSVNRMVKGTLAALAPWLEADS